MFLATTAINSFWDTKQKIIFLTPGCLLYRDRHRWQSLDYAVMPSPWRDRQAYYDAAKYTYETYEYLLGHLHGYLNGIHDTKHGRRFWQIIIGPWLLHFIEAFYDRFCCLKKALDTYSPIETFLLDEASYITPHNFRHFIDLYWQDFYNLQLYSQILTHFKVGGRSQKMTIEPYSEPKDGIVNYYFFKKFLNKLSLKIANKVPIVLWDMYLDNRYFLGYIRISKFSAFPVLFENGLQSNYPVVTDKKRMGLAGLPAKDEFTRIVANSFPVNFPALYLEGFDDFLGKCLSIFKKGRPKILQSAAGWYFNEELKFLAGSWMEKGTIICGMQHGGLYGTGKWLAPEKHEIDICDYFYTWGWQMPGKASVKPLPSPKIAMLKLRNKRETNSINKYLFIVSSLPRYLFRFFSVPIGEMYNEYLTWRNDFIRTLHPEVRRQVLVRLFLRDYDLSQKELILDEFPDMCLDDPKRKFLSSLDQSELAIIDHPITTMLECLAKNHPTILFWDPLYWETRPEAEPFFEELAKARIWHKDPTSAGLFLNQISHDPLEWWHDKKTQSARREFVNRFAADDRNWAKIWWSEMQKLAEID